MNSSSETDSTWEEDPNAVVPRVPHDPPAATAEDMAEEIQRGPSNDNRPAAHEPNAAVEDDEETDGASTQAIPSPEVILEVEDGSSPAGPSTTSEHQGPEPSNVVAEASGSQPVDAPVAAPAAGTAGAAARPLVPPPPPVTHGGPASLLRASLSRPASPWGAGAARASQFLWQSMAVPQAIRMPGTPDSGGYRHPAASPPRIPSVVPTVAIGPSVYSAPPLPLPLPNPGIYASNPTVYNPNGSVQTAHYVHIFLCKKIHALSALAATGLDLVLTTNTTLDWQSRVELARFRSNLHAISIDAYDIGCRLDMSNGHPVSPVLCSAFNHLQSRWQNTDQDIPASRLLMNLQWVPSIIPRRDQEQHASSESSRRQRRGAPY